LVRLPIEIEDVVDDFSQVVTAALLAGYQRGPGGQRRGESEYELWRTSARGVRSWGWSPRKLTASLAGGLGSLVFGPLPLWSLVDPSPAVQVRGVTTAAASYGGHESTASSRRSRG